MLLRRVVLLMCAGILVLAAGPNAPAVEIWVAPDGSAVNAGTREEPLASLHAALRKARELRRVKDASIADGVRIFLRGGTHPLVEPVLIRPEDAGTVTSPTLIAAAPGERPVLSGGVAIGGWRRIGATEEVPGLSAAARGHAWVADAPIFNGRRLEFRQLWINDVKAVRAREPDGDDMWRIVDWDKTTQEAVIPAHAAPTLRTLEGVELTIHQMWEIANLRLRAWHREGERTRVAFHQPESRIQSEHPWPPPIVDRENPARNSAFFFAGALEFLDQPGEWAQEIPSGRIYYWPRTGEDLARDRVIAPALETLVEIAGTVDRPVAHVELRGIAFAHTTWLRPSVLGHVPHQATMPMLDAYRLTPPGTPDWRSLDNQAWIARSPAAVTVSGAQHIRFARCRFEHLAIGGLDFAGGTRDSVIEGCVFRDVGGNGLQCGNYGDAGIEIHLPYDPADARVVSERVRIANNLFVDTANEDWGGIALSVGWARELTIEHNEILHTSYTGISVGWGWTRTPNAARRHVVRANRIHRFATRMADCAGIYMLGAQPQSLVAENVIDAPVMSQWVHDPEHWGYVYLDEGSSFTTVRDNWSPVEKFIKNANGPGNVWHYNGPNVAEEIRARAGLQPEFQDLLEGLKP